jgi:hypothetical protein
LLTAYLAEPRFSIRIAAVSALGGRGDATAVPSLEALLSSKDLSIEMAPMIKRQIARLQNKSGAKSPRDDDDDEEASAPAKEASDNSERLERIEQITQEMNDRLKAIESRLPAAKNQ